MENKKTTELLNILGAYSIKERINEEAISDKEVEDYVDALKELQQRVPFSLIFKDDYYSEDGKTLEERIDDIEENAEDFIGKIRRHKHDPNNGDVLIRI